MLIISEEQFRNVLKNLKDQDPSLETMDFAYPFNSEEKVALFAAIKNNKIVRTLKLNSGMLNKENLYWQSEEITQLAEAIKTTAIEILDLSNTKLEGEHIYRLAVALAYTRIHTLKLYNNVIGSLGIRALAAVLPRTNVHTLSITYNSITYDELKILAAVLPSTKIRELNLSGNLIGNAGIQFLALVLPWTIMERLYIVDCGQDRECLSSIFDIINSPSKMQILHFSSALRLNADNLRHIANALKNNFTLRNLMYEPTEPAWIYRLDLAFFERRRTEDRRDESHKYIGQLLDRNRNVGALTTFMVAYETMKRRPPVVTPAGRFLVRDGDEKVSRMVMRFMG